jgi:hypothetical protein
VWPNLRESGLWYHCGLRYTRRGGVRWVYACLFSNRQALASDGYKVFKKVSIGMRQR